MVVVYKLAYNVYKNASSFRQQQQRGYRYKRFAQEQNSYAYSQKKVPHNPRKLWANFHRSFKYLSAG